MHYSPNASIGKENVTHSHPQWMNEHHQAIGVLGI